MKRLTTTAVCALALVGALACFGCSSGGAASSASASASAIAASASASSVAASASTASSSAASASSSAKLAAGVYTAEFDTDSSMFHANEANDGKGELVVKEDGSMTIHVSLASTRIVNLYVGTAEQAKADSAGVLQPTNDKVTYRDGAQEEVYGFDVPVPAIGEEFAVAILGEKGTWYDHKVTVLNPVKK